MTIPRPRLAAVSLIALTIMLAGCVPRGDGAASSPSPIPTPTAACPEIEGVDLPPGCAPYDPDAAMAENERYRERMDVDEDTRQGNALLITPLTDALEELQARGEITVDSVNRALSDAGLENPQVRDDYGSILFGVAGPTGGCLFGEVSADVVSVEMGGYILDGGCLPSQ